MWRYSNVSDLIPVISNDIVKSMPKEQRQQLMNILTQMDMMELSNYIPQIMDELRLNATRIEELSTGQEEIKREVEKQLEIERSRFELEKARHRVEEHRFGFVSLNDLGQIYNVSIGSKTIGKLLRLAGLAKDKQSKTEPLRSSIMSNYAKSVMYGDFPTYQWNPEKCIKKIDEWLMEMSIIDEFYSIEDERKLTEYINGLYERYGD
jgi:hypothetical protein